MLLPQESNQERKRLGRQGPCTPVESGETKLIVILGGESEQGSSVISALLSANSKAFNQFTNQGSDAVATARSSSKILDAQSWPKTTTASTCSSNSNQDANGGIKPQQQQQTALTASAAVLAYHRHQKINHRPSTAPPSTSIVTAVPLPLPLTSPDQPSRFQRLGPFLDDSFLDTSTAAVQTPPLSESGTPGSIENDSPFSISTPLAAESSLTDQVEVQVGDVNLREGGRIDQGDGHLGLSGLGSSDSSSNASSPPIIVDIMPSPMSIHSVKSPSTVNDVNQMKGRSTSLGVTSNPFSLTLPSFLESRPVAAPDVKNHQPPWRVRAILRSNKENEVDSDIAFQLRARGVELAYVDFDQLTPLEGETSEDCAANSGLTEALEGAWGVLVAPIDRDGYAVGSPVCGFSGFAAPNAAQLTAAEEASRTEVRGKLLADAAARSGVTHFIWSCTGDIQRVMNAQALSAMGAALDLSSTSADVGAILPTSGTVSVAAHAGYISPTIESAPLNAPISVLAHASVFRYLKEKVKKKEIQSCSALAIALPFENFVFSKAQGGFYLEIQTPTREPLPFCSSEDVGTCALLAFNSPSRYNLSHIDVCSEVTTPQELCAQLTQIIYISSKRVLPFPNVTREDFEQSKSTTFSKDQEAWNVLNWLLSWGKCKAGARGLGSGGRNGFTQAKSDYFHSRDPTSSMNVYLASKLVPWRDYAIASVDDLLPSWRDFSNPSSVRKQLPLFQAPERFTHSVHASLSNSAKGSPSALNGLSHSLVASGLKVGAGGSCASDSMSLLNLPLPIPASSALPVSAVISSVTNPNLAEPTAILRKGFAFQSSPTPSPPPTSPKINSDPVNTPSSPSKASKISSGTLTFDPSLKIPTSV